MNQVAIKSPQGELAAVPTFTPAQLQLIKRSVAKDLTDTEFDVFVEICKAVRLNPLRRQIYALVYNKDNEAKRNVVYITGIDGMRAVAARGRDYRADDQPYEIEVDEAAKDPATNPLGLVRAVVRAYKQDRMTGEWHPQVGIAYWEEFAPIKEKWTENERGKWVPTGKFYLDRSGQWGKMPRLMLAKCAEAQALRKGWPEELSAIYAEEETHHIGPTIDATATEIVNDHEREERYRKLGGSKDLPIQWTWQGKIEWVAYGAFYDEAQKWLRGERGTDKPGAAEVHWFISVNAEALRRFWAHDRDAAVQLRGLFDEIIERERAEAAQDAVEEGEPADSGAHDPQFDLEPAHSGEAAE